MWGSNFLLNCLVFLLAFNISRLSEWVRTRHFPQGNPVFTLVLPVALAFSLTILDSLRFYFVYQLLLFLLSAVLIYWGLVVVSRWYERK